MEEQEMLGQNFEYVGRQWKHILMRDCLTSDTFCGASVEFHSWFCPVFVVLLLRHCTRLCERVEGISVWKGIFFRGADHE
jgi:hypothetical protein